jgi:hypothetical protein
MPAFRPVEETAIFEELARRGPPWVPVLASYETGNALPAWAPVRVAAGHGPESADLDEWLPRLRAFFSPATPDAERIALITETGARYVFWGPAEHALGSWDPSSASFLQEIARKGAYRLYEVDEISR